jgi:hypothetical protein
LPDEYIGIHHILWVEDVRDITQEVLFKRMILNDQLHEDPYTGGFHCVVSCVLKDKEKDNVVLVIREVSSEFL